MGIHYAYVHKKFRLQASIYNGEGNYRFEGRYNVFRICPNSDGIFAIGQAEYRHRGSHNYLGGTVHTNSDIQPDERKRLLPEILANKSRISTVGN